MVTLLYNANSKKLRKKTFSFITHAILNYKTILHATQNITMTSFESIESSLQLFCMVYLSNYSVIFKGNT